MYWYIRYLGFWRNLFIFLLVSVKVNLFYGIKCVFNLIGIYFIKGVWKRFIRIVVGKFWIGLYVCNIFVEVYKFILRVKGKLEG